MTPREQAIKAMARAAYEAQRMDHDGVHWELLPRNSYERARILEDMRAALSALLATLPALGLRVVPVEATNEMCEAWADNERQSDLGGTVYRCPAWEMGPRAQKDWSVMLAAAPNPLETVMHASDCAIHNAPAMTAGECDCGAARNPLEDSHD